MIVPEGPKGPKTGNTLLDRFFVKLDTFTRDTAELLRVLYEPVVNVAPSAGDGISPSWDVVKYNGPGSETMALPSAARIAGRRSRALYVMNLGPGTLTLAALPGETVASAASMALPTLATVLLLSDGETQWRTLGGAFRATSLVLSSILDVAGQVTLRGLTVFPGATSGAVATVQLIGDLRQIVFGTSNAVIVSNQTVGGGLSIGTTAAEKIGFHGVAPIARPILATGTGKTVDDVITALQTRGLVRQS